MKIHILIFFVTSELLIMNLDTIAEAVNEIVLRDEDGNLLNKGLNELESCLCLKIQEEGANCAVGESVESAYRAELLFALKKAISDVAKKFKIN